MRSLSRIAGARVVAVILIGCGAVACSVLTSLDGLAGGASADGGPGINDGPSPQETATGSSPDAGDAPPPAADGGSDSALQPTDAGGAIPDASDSGADAKGPGADAAGTDAATGYCATLSPAPLFCDDFDQGALVTPWNQVTGTNGTAALDGTFFESAPNAMLSSVLASAPAANVDVAAYKSFTAKQGVAGTYTLAFDLRIDSQDTSASSDAVLAAIQLWNGSQIWDLELEVAYVSSTGDFSASMTTDTSGTSSAFGASAHLPAKTWTRVALAITLPSGSAGTPATLSFNGAQVASATVKVTTTTPIPEIILGPTFATPAAGGWAVRYDNVTFD